LASLLFFNIASGGLLAVMAYVFWFGVGSQRRDLGRFIAIVCGAMSGYLAWETLDLLF
jgi:hypothetical protein